MNHKYIKQSLVNADVVFTWVNGLDPSYIKRKKKVLKDFSKLDNSRTRSSDEIQYSVEGVFRYMKWNKGMIYIVTDNQCPSFLPKYHPRIKVIDHKDIIPSKYLPTYNSISIELFLDRIPGLSERFIYFNDDIFLVDYIEEDFFNNHIHVCRKQNKVNRELSKQDTWNRIICNTYKVMGKILRKRIETYHNLQHVPYVLSKSNYRDLRKLIPKSLFEQTALSKQRSVKQIDTITILHIIRNYYTKESKFTTKFDKDIKFLILRDHNPEKQLFYTFNNQIKVLCINDEFYNHTTQALLKQTLNYLYPNNKQFINKLNLLPYQLLPNVIFCSKQFLLSYQYKLLKQLTLKSLPIVHNIVLCFISKTTNN